MRKRLLACCTALSLMLAGATALVWVHCRHMEDFAVWLRTGTERHWGLSIRLADGAANCILGHSSQPWDLVTAAEHKGIGSWIRWSHASSSATDVRWGGAPSSLAVHSGPDDWGGYEWQLFVRYWVVLAACAIAP